MLVLLLIALLLLLLLMLLLLFLLLVVLVVLPLQLLRVTLLAAVVASCACVWVGACESSVCVCKLCVTSSAPKSGSFSGSSSTIPSVPSLSTSLAQYLAASLNGGLPSSEEEQAPFT